MCVNEHTVVRLHEDGFINMHAVMCAWDFMCLHVSHSCRLSAFSLCVWMNLGTESQLQTLMVSLFQSLWSLPELQTLIHFCHSTCFLWWPPSIFIIILLLSFIMSFPSTHFSKAVFFISLLSPPHLTTRQSECTTTLSRLKLQSCSLTWIFHLRFQKWSSHRWQGSCKQRWCKVGMWIWASLRYFQTSVGY